MGAKVARTRPTRVEAILGIDRRSRVSRELRAQRDALLSSVPQPPSPAAAALCERAAILGTHLLELDRRALESGGLEPGQLRVYSSLQSQQSRILRQLGSLRAVRPSAPSLDELFGAGEEGVVAA